MSVHLRAHSVLILHCIFNTAESPAVLYILDKSLRRTHPVVSDLCCALILFYHTVVKPRLGVGSVPGLRLDLTHPHWLQTSHSASHISHSACWEEAAALTRLQWCSQSIFVTQTLCVCVFVRQCYWFIGSVIAGSHPQLYTPSFTGLAEPATLQHVTGGCVCGLLCV